MSVELSGNIVFDTGPLIEIVSGSKAGAYAKKLLQSGITEFTSEINLAELQYLVCRKTSEEKSEKAIDALRNSGLFQVSSFQEHARSAANMKCRRASHSPIASLFPSENL